MKMVKKREKTGKDKLGATERNRGRILWDILVATGTQLPKPYQFSAKLLIPAKLVVDYTTNRTFHTVSPCKYWSRPLDNGRIVLCPGTTREVETIQCELPYSVAESWARYSAATLFGRVKGHCPEEQEPFWLKFNQALITADIDRVRLIWNNAPFEDGSSFNSFAELAGMALNILLEWTRFKNVDIYKSVKDDLIAKLDLAFLLQLEHLVEAYHNSAITTRNRDLVEYDIG
jgi:hypothetical protein